MIIKVCGMRDEDNIRAVEKLDIDWIGFVFWTDSPRYVSQIRSRAGIIPDYSSLGKCQQESGSRKKHVGVFVDDMPQNIVTRVVNYDLDIVQLHGSESIVMIDNLRRTLDPDIHQGVKIMKAISVMSKDDLVRCKEYEGHADYLLLDVKSPLTGDNSGKSVWDILNSYDGNIPFLLSGNIGIDDVESVRTFSHPMFLGIDISSCFETETAVKDVDKLREFVKSVRREA